MSHDSNMIEFQPNTPPPTIAISKTEIRINTSAVKLSGCNASGSLVLLYDATTGTVAVQFSEFGVHQRGYRLDSHGCIRISSRGFLGYHSLSFKKVGGKHRASIHDDSGYISARITSRG